jgi:hypothetical protein
MVCIDVHILWRTTVTYKSPLGANYGWIVNQDFHYVSRELDEETHASLALSEVLNDPELYKIQRTLGYPVILRVLVGKYTIHVRVYNRKDVETKPDRLVSRLAERDPAAYMIFNPAGGMELVNEVLREKAQGHIPKYYADRRFSTNRLKALDGLEVQLKSAHPEKYGLNKPSQPLQPEEEWVTVIDRDSPSLEPVTIEMRPT